jgi:hypothetical protein
MDSRAWARPALSSVKFPRHQDGGAATLQSSPTDEIQALRAATLSQIEESRQHRTFVAD